MKHNAPIAYLPDARFSAVENMLLQKGQIARVIPGSEIPALGPPLAQLAQYAGIVITSESCFRKFVQRVKFCFVESNELIAFCFIDGNNGIIVISRAFSLMIFSTSMFLLSTEPVVRKSLLNLPILITEDNYKYIPRDECGLPVIGMLDKSTYFPMLYLSALTMSSIILHEMAHFANGHLFLLRERPDEFESSIVRQAIEYDADCYAVAGLENFMARMTRRGIALIDNPIAVTELVSVAAAIAFCSIGRQMVHPEDGWRQSAASHPPEPRRVSSIIRLGGNLLHKKGLSFDESFRRTCENLAVIVDASRLAFNHEIVDYEAMIEESYASYSYLDDLHEGWAHIRPLLEPLAVGAGKLAPLQRRMNAAEARLDAKSKR